MWRTWLSVAPPMFKSLQLPKRHLAMQSASLVPTSSALATSGKCRNQYSPEFQEGPVPPEPQKSWRTLLLLLQSNVGAGLGFAPTSGFPGCRRADATAALAASPGIARARISNLRRTQIISVCLHPHPSSKRFSRSLWNIKKQSGKRALPLARSIPAPFPSVGGLTITHPLARNVNKTSFLPSSKTWRRRGLTNSTKCLLVTLNGCSEFAGQDASIRQGFGRTQPSVASRQATPQVPKLPCPQLGCLRHARGRRNRRLVLPSGAQVPGADKLPKLRHIPPSARGAVIHRTCLGCVRVSVLH